MCKIDHRAISLLRCVHYTMYKQHLITQETCVNLRLTLWSKKFHRILRIHLPHTNSFTTLHSISCGFFVTKINTLSSLGTGDVKLLWFPKIFDNDENTGSVAKAKLSLNIGKEISNYHKVDYKVPPYVLQQNLNLLQVEHCLRSWFRSFWRDVVPRFLRDK